ncbi:MAG TPA: group 1 truncated hemoglobin [Longimicrobiales bacterium]|nr:group 1 truncated hemoglobin [Longimicrobiales bacterium]
MTSIRACVIVPAVFIALAVTLPRTADAQSPAPAASLYERLGGLPAISLVVSDFMDVFLQDPVIMANEAVRQRKTAEAAPYITYQVTTLVCEATGGPCTYTGLEMMEAHRGLRVTAEEWDRMVEIFSATLQRHDVDEAETQELFAILGPTRDEIVGH